MDRSQNYAHHPLYKSTHQTCTKYAVATFTASRKHSPTTIFTAMIKYFMRVTGSGYVYGEPFSPTSIFTAND